MKTSIKPVFENHTVRPSSLWDLECSQWIHINKKYYVHRVTDNGLITSISFFPPFIINKQITVTCEEGSRDFQVPELPDSHASRSRMTPEAVGSTPLAFPDAAAPSKRNHTVQAQWATHVGCYLRRILTLGKPSHFSLHSGHSVFFEEAHHRARQCRQKLCPQFKVVGL